MRGRARAGNPQQRYRRHRSGPCAGQPDGEDQERRERKDVGMAASEFVGAAAERPGRDLCAFKPQGRRPFRGRSSKMVMKALTVATGCGFPRTYRPCTVGRPCAVATHARAMKSTRHRWAVGHQSACHGGPPVGLSLRRLLNRRSSTKQPSLRRQASLRCYLSLRSRTPGLRPRRGGRTTASGSPARLERRTCSARG